MVPKLIGIRGALLGYILSLCCAVFVYGRSVVAGIETLGFSLPVIVIFTIFMTALLALGLMLTKNGLGILFSKLFFIQNALVFVLAAAFYPTFAPLAVLATLWGSLSWTYLSMSERVRNTYGQK